MPADVCITEYTDPGCPWAYSAEPFRRRLTWLYGDRLEWRVKLVGLAESPDEYLKKGFTPEKQARSFASIARDHGMPIDSSVRPRMAATIPACRAVVAAQLRAPEAQRALLRRLPSATSPASCSTSPRRSTAPHAKRASTPPHSIAGPPNPRWRRPCARTWPRRATR
jgi:predicted DsbA family dithiol-disulfide isomerase